MRTLAARLWEARRDGFATNLENSWMPANETEAYEVQELVNDQSGHGRLGFKVGSTSKEAQAYLGSDGPNCAELLSPYVYTSPANVSVSPAHMPQIEGEFAFKLGKDLPARSTPYEINEIASAIDAVAGAIEIVGSRISGGLSNAGPLLLTADSGANIALVTGPWHADWSMLDLPTHQVRIFINKHPHGEGTGAKALGNPLNVLLWLANRQSETGRGLKHGEIISTGTCTGLDPVKTDDQVIADFGCLGRVEISL